MGNKRLFVSSKVFIYLSQVKFYQQVTARKKKKWTAIATRFCHDILNFFIYFFIFYWALCCCQGRQRKMIKLQGPWLKTSSVYYKQTFNCNNKVNVQVKYFYPLHSVHAEINSCSSSVLALCDWEVDTLDGIYR